MAIPLVVLLNGLTDYKSIHETILKHPYYYSEQNDIVDSYRSELDTLLELLELLFQNESISYDTVYEAVFPLLRIYASALNYVINL